jgi:hypothetical protein
MYLSSWTSSDKFQIMGNCNGVAPVRVLVTIGNRSPHWDSAWLEPHKITAIATEAVKSSKLCPLRDEPSILLLATEKWHNQIFIVYDIDNHTYNAATAHKPDQNTCAVIFVRLGRNATTTFATPSTRQEVNRSVASMHNVNGVGSVPPFEEDHTGCDPPTYPDPRESSLLGGTDTTFFASESGGVG